MQEYLTEAIVLEKEPLKEIDERVVLFTKHLGKITAKITSGRKITSKLSSHLEPMNLADIRLIKKNNFQIGDALKKKKISLSPAVLRVVCEMTIDLEPDHDLWRALKRGESTSAVLTVLGFSPALAKCGLCDAEHPKYFVLRDSFYACRTCLPRSVSRSEHVAV